MPAMRGDDDLVRVPPARRPRPRAPWLALAVLPWSPAAAAATIGVATAHLLGQQALRLGANDTRTQLAEDDAVRLGAGAAPGQVATGAVVDLATSLATTTLVVSDTGTVLASTATLDGATPRPPCRPCALPRPATRGPSPGNPVPASARPPSLPPTPRPPATEPSWSPDR